MRGRGRHPGPPECQDCGNSGMLLPRVSMTTAHRLIKEPTCDWLPSSSPILCSFTFPQLSLTMLLNITLKLPVAYHILKGFKERGRLHCEYLGFFFLTSKALFSLHVETVFVCLKEYVEIMCDFFLFFFGNCYCYKHTVSKSGKFKAKSARVSFQSPLNKPELGGLS